MRYGNIRCAGRIDKDHRPLSCLDGNASKPSPVMQLAPRHRSLTFGRTTQPVCDRMTVTGSAPASSGFIHGWLGALNVGNDGHRHNAPCRRSSSLTQSCFKLGLRAQRAFDVFAFGSGFILLATDCHFTGEFGQMAISAQRSGFS